MLKMSKNYTIFVRKWWIYNTNAWIFDFLDFHWKYELRRATKILTSLRFIIKKKYLRSCKAAALCVKTLNCESSVMCLYNGQNIHKYVLDSSYSINTARRKEAAVCAAHRTYISDVLHIAQLPNLDSFLGVGRRRISW